MHLISRNPKKSKIQHAVFLFSVSLLSGCVNQYSQEFIKQLDQDYYSKWPPLIQNSAYPAHSLGEALMPYFSEHAQACGLFSDSGLTLPVNRDYIPSEIQKYTGTPLNTTITTIPDVLGENLFYYTFPKLNPEHMPHKLTPQSLFDLNEGELSKSLGLSHEYPVVPEKGFSSWRIRQSCAGFLNSHLAGSYENKGPLPFIPYGAFKAAVQNDKDLKSSIVAVSGRFSSPLATLLSRDEISPDALNLKLHLWYKYRNAATQNQLPQFLEQNSLLQEFQGLLINRATSREYINELNADGVMTLDLSTLNTRLEGKLDSRYSVRNTFSSSRYTTLIYCNGDKKGQGQPCDLKTMPMPTPEQLVNSFSRINPEGGKDAFSTLQPGRTLKFWQDIAGIPSEYCNKNERRWEFALKKQEQLFYPGAAPQLTVAPLPAEKDNSPKCRFTIEGKLRKDLDTAKLAGENENLELAFELVNKDSLKYQDTTYQLKIPGQIVFGLKNQIQPIIVGKEPLGYEKVGRDPQHMTLQWEFDVVMREGENGQIIDFAKGGTLTGQKTQLIRFIENRLEQLGQDHIEVKALPDQDGRKFFHITVRNSNYFDFSDPSQYFDDQYTLKSVVPVPLINREHESVPIEIRLAYPVRKERPQPEASPQPSPSASPLSALPKTFWQQAWQH